VLACGESEIEFANWFTIVPASDPQRQESAHIMRHLPEGQCVKTASMAFGCKKAGPKEAPLTVDSTTDLSI
jgi:hypothetical protein